MPIPHWKRFIKIFLNNFFSCVLIFINMKTKLSIWNLNHFFVNTLLDFGAQPFSPSLLSSVLSLPLFPWQKQENVCKHVGLLLLCDVAYSPRSNPGVKPIFNGADVHSLENATYSLYTCRAWTGFMWKYNALLLLFIYFVYVSTKTKMLVLLWIQLRWR